MTIRERAYSTPPTSSEYNSHHEGISDFGDIPAQVKEGDRWVSPQRDLKPQSGHIGLAREAAAASSQFQQRANLNAPRGSSDALSIDPSADNYDSIENTNNKKRKIPTPASSSM
jgi:hypothetical protein